MFHTHIHAHVAFTISTNKRPKPEKLPKNNAAAEIREQRMESTSLSSSLQGESRLLQPFKWRTHLYTHQINQEDKGLDLTHLHKTTRNLHISTNIILE